jgi:hypothetical protein
MKKFVLGLMILGSFSLLADEKKVRLSEKSMSDFSIQKAECIDGTAQAASIEIELSLNTKIKLIFNKSIYYGCDYHVRD